MKSWVGTAFSLVALLVSSSAFAGQTVRDQNEAVQQLSAFFGLRGPQLYRGHDQLGECRVFVYPQGSQDSREVWLEGTFQKKDGPVRGLVIPFMLSTSPDKSRLDDFTFTSEQLIARATYPTDSGGRTVQIAVRLIRDSRGQITEIAYRTSNGGRVCTSLQRMM